MAAASGQWNPVSASLSRVDVLQVAALGAVLTERVRQLILNSDECPSPAICPGIYLGSR